MCARGRVAVVVAFGLAACGRIGFDEGVTPEVADEARASIAVGEISSCAIRDGDVYCWGDGEYGQLGADGPAIALRPVRVDGIPKAARIAAGRYHVCIVTEAGEVWCWGGNEYGRIGVTPPSSFIAVAGGPRTDPLRVELPGPAIDVSVSFNSTCAVLASGAVSCWGRDNIGQLGRGVVGTDTGVNLPALVMNISDARRVSLDDDSACALRSDGSIACWGENGRGLIDASEMNRTIATPVAGFADATAIALGGDHLCAIIDGRVGCRGANSYGELGAGTGDSTEVVYSSLDDAVAVEAGFLHTCAVRATGVAECWGDNDYYVLGDGTFEDRAVPTTVANMDDAIAISTGDYSSCAVRADDVVTCWGYGARGQIGDGRSAEARARKVTTLPNALYVAVGRDHSCVSDSADVACWGANRRGQLGTGGNLEPTATPQVLSFNWPSGIVQLVAGETFTCARLANTSVYCWGRNNVGQLGLGNYDDQMTPVQLALPPVISLAAGREHVCALGMDQMLRCWGYNSEGQLGDGSLVTQPTPAVVATNIDDVVAGNEHTCVLSGNAISCWGSNGSGQLGDGSQTMHASATLVTGGITAVGLRSGGDATCALRATGGVMCWGQDDSNVLLAPGAVYYQLTPIISTQTELFRLGGSTGCLADACWGANSVGQVGAGDLGYYSQPTQVMDLPGSATTFAVSTTHACALVGGETYCWGENASGEIGAGTTSTATFAATTVAFP